MKNTTCELPDCDRPRYQAHRMCGSHFMKQYRHGDPHYVAPPKWQDIRGRRFGSLVVLHREQHRWVCQCDCGAISWAVAGNLNLGTHTTCGNPRIHHRSDSPTYHTVHDRLSTDYGPASRHACVDCGRTARHWSYNHTDPHEQVENDLPYSSDAKHYSPRCVSCHKVFDLAQYESVTPRGHASTARTRTGVGQFSDAS